MPGQNDFAAEIRRKLARDSDLAERVAEATLNAQIAEQILAAREAAHLTQTALASLANTTQSVIARMEDADYEGHSLKLLQRIADALGLVLRVEFYAKYEPAQQIQSTAAYADTFKVAWQPPEAVDKPQTGWQNVQVTVRSVGSAA